MGEPNVSEWHDHSGNGNHAVQATAALRPTIAGPQALYASGGTLAIRASPPLHDDLLSVDDELERDFLVGRHARPVRHYGV